MSKKIIAVCVAVTTLAASGSAFASRARELVMGTADPFGVLSTSGHGTFFYDDNYNVFFNPAYVNDFKNWASVEKSNSPGVTAEGGFVASIMNFNVGAYFNRGDAITTLPVPPSTFAAGTTAATLTRPIDIMIGSDMGVKWGVGLTFGNTHQSTFDASSTTIRAGVEVMDLEPFANLNLTSQSATGGTLKNMGFTLGTRYHWGEWVPFAAWTYAKPKFSPTSGSDIDGTKSQAFGVGLGRDAKLTDDVMMDYAISYWRSTALDRNVLPINMAFEANLASWITGRVGLSYNLYDRTKGFSTADSTSGRIGATIHAGKANLDVAIGNSNVATATTAEATDAPGANAQVLGIGPQMFYAAGVSYSW